MARIGAPDPTLRWEGGGHADDPESVAPLAVYLASEAAADVNGQIFGVRGGDIHLYSNPTIDRQILTYGRRFTMDELDEQMPRTLAFDLADPVQL